MVFEWKLDLNIVIASFALLATCLFFYVQSRRERLGLKREIYQRLELASNDLFRFEADHLNILDRLYSSEHPWSKNSREYRGLIAYVTQVLNLFEMAVRFRQQEIMPRDVFGSWVIWFYDLCAAENFPYIWEDIKLNYLPELREIIDTGILVIAQQKESGKSDAQQKFFEFLAARYEDIVIEIWGNKNHVH